MHVFLQGPKNIGKSTVIAKTLDIIMAETPLKLGGFITWNGGKSDPHVYMRQACSDMEGESYCLANYDIVKGGLISNISVFENEGVSILDESTDADLIIMDELGFLESSAPMFRKTILNVLAGGVPVLGVLRLGDVPWHADIKQNPMVSLYDVSKNNRDDLPRELAGVMQRNLDKL